MGFSIRIVAAVAGGSVMAGVLEPAYVIAASFLYVAITALLSVLGWRLGWRWAPYATIGVDAATVAAVFLVGGDVPAMPGILGAMAIAAAGAAGYAPLGVATVAVVAGVVAAGLASPDASTREATGTAAALASIGAALLLALRPFLNAEREAAAWRRVADATQHVNRAVAPSTIAVAIVESAREALAADSARLWTRSARTAEFESTAVAGDAAFLPDSLPRLALEEVASGNDSVARTLFEEQAGELLLLPVGPNGSRGVLGWRWVDRAPEFAHADQARHVVRLAEDALARAEAHAIDAAVHHREGTLRETVERVSASAEPAAVAGVVVEAVRRGLGGEALIMTTDGEVHAGEASLASLETPERFSLDVGDGLTLLVSVANVTTPAERAWLEALARAARDALAAARVRERQRAELRLLRDALDAMPAPAVLQDARGVVVCSSRTFNALAISPPPARWPQQHPVEVTTGSPPRVFTLEKAEVAGGCRLTVYREVTLERAALRAKDDLIATMGHELRSPLTSVRGYSQMMASHLDVVREQVGRLDAMIQDFLDSAQMPAANMPMRRDTLDPADLAHAAAERFRGAWPGREMSLVLAPAPPVEGDPARLGQVLDNLLGNAAKYSGKDCPVELVVSAEERSVLFAVRDEGVGIAPEHLPRVFERSYRVPGRDEEGHGLGLAIVHDLVSAHGGDVWAESDGPGLGSTFTVRLPAKPEEPAGALERI